MTKAKLAAPVAAPTRGTVRGRAVRANVHRCPFCHVGVDAQAEAWTACQGCLARHHTACWAEGGRCGACGDAQRPLAPAAEPRPRWWRWTMRIGGGGIFLIGLATTFVVCAAVLLQPGAVDEVPPGRVEVYVSPHPLLVDSLRALRRACTTARREAITSRRSLTLTVEQTPGYGAYAALQRAAGREISALPAGVTLVGEPATWTFRADGQVESAGGAGVTLLAPSGEALPLRVTEQGRVVHAGAGVRVP